jgi:hypothetical protein
MEFVVGKFYQIKDSGDETVVVQAIENDGTFRVNEKIMGDIILAPEKEMVGRKIMLNDYTIENFDCKPYKEPTLLKYSPELCDLFLHMAVQTDNEEWFNKLHEKKRRMVKNV